MKVLVISHIKDIDGMGCVVLGKLGFERCDNLLCDHYDIDKLTQILIDTGDIYMYDKIYCTDICFSEAMLEQIKNNDQLSNKVLVLDHHPFNLEKSQQYDNVHVCVEDENGLCSGTSLFYQHLLDNGYISRDNKLDEFVELTRRSDTWEWKKYNDKKADNLAQLFNIVGIVNYIDRIYGKLKDKNELSFDFSEEEKQMIYDYKTKMKKALEKCKSGLQVSNYNGNVVGVGTIDYNFRNDIAEYLRNQNYPIDILLLLNLKDLSCSLRSISESADVNEFAKMFGGGGSQKASGCPLSQELVDALNVDMSKFSDEQNK